MKHTYEIKDRKEGVTMTKEGITKEAIKKLPDQCRRYCETKHALICHSVLSGIEQARIENTKKLRGYLDCLRDLGILMEIEVRAVYMHYATP